MEWIPCTECIYVNEDCVEARRADGCYCGERERTIKEMIEDRFIDDLNLALKNNFDYVPLEKTLKIAEELVAKGWRKL